ncbi:MAG: helix-turn-helix transcriptional regulator [Pseudorhodoplanes sp.]|nr:helix-turn-helix transcriptional regulator [Pseudorhodoplanes sp.]
MHNSGQGIRAPGVVYASKVAVHPMYMTGSKDLRWRKTMIRHWREFREFTLEAASEALSRPPYNLDYTHNSLGRVERGMQMPTIELIEALAKLYQTDTHSLLNRRPSDGDAAPGKDAPGAKDLLNLWDRAAPDERGLIFDIVKRVVKTGT